MHAAIVFLVLHVVEARHRARDLPECLGKIYITSRQSGDFNKTSEVSLHFKVSQSDLGPFPLCWVLGRSVFSQKEPFQSWQLQMLLSKQAWIAVRVRNETRDTHSKIRRQRVCNIFVEIQAIPFSRELYISWDMAANQFWARARLHLADLAFTEALRSLRRRLCKRYGTSTLPHFSSIWKHAAAGSSSAVGDDCAGLYRVKLHGWDSGLLCCSWLASFRQTKEAKAVSIPKISSFLSLLSRESLRKTDSGGETSAKATRCAYLSSMFYADIRRISKHHSNLKTTFVQLYGLWLHGFMVERCKSFCSATFGLVQGKEDMVCIYTYICSTIYIKL